MQKGGMDRMRRLDRLVSEKCIAHEGQCIFRRLKVGCTLQHVGQRHWDERGTRVQAIVSDPVFFNAMAKISTPKTALATMSAIEYPICT